MAGHPGRSIIEVRPTRASSASARAPWWHFSEVIKAEIAPALIGADPLTSPIARAVAVPPWQITANTGEMPPSVAFNSVELALTG